MTKPILLFLLILISCKVEGQTSTTPSLSCSDSVKAFRREWANLGFGISSDKVFNSIAGVNLGVDYHWLPKRITYQAGFTGTGKLFSGATLYVLNVGIGKTLITRPFLISLIAGPGLMWGKNFEVENIDGKRFVKAGLTINAEIILKPIKNLGIGCELYSNLNAVQNASGIRIIIHLNNEK
ncbi:MAG: hypothetical protein ABI763_17555 [Bacteroidota bacterium]